jgi:MATE family multidrug resistance protein
MNEGPFNSAAHAFDKKPHRTLLLLSAPALVSLIAEPLTGLVDTAFVAELGTESLAALGIGTTLLSGCFWMFNFLSVGVQSEVAHHHGKGNMHRARGLNALALALAMAFGVLLLVVGWPSSNMLADAMGAEAGTHQDAVNYLRIRLLGAPAVLLMATAFGSLRGLQRMRTPMLIAVFVNVLNIGLDAIFIFGLGPIPAFGISGAAWASTVSQWSGAALALLAIGRGLGWPEKFTTSGIRVLMRIGGDMFVRTGLLTVFLVLGTRAATSIGADAGAAHHVIRQVWLFSALALDALAITAISLIGWYVGANLIARARRVAALTCIWSLFFGILLAVGMLLLERQVKSTFLPEEAWLIFSGAWFWSALAQPLNALCFATDGIHWGTRDFRYLRNGMILAAIVGIGGLLVIDLSVAEALTQVWQITAVWIFARAAVGILRIWPGFGNAPIGANRDKLRA